MLHSVNVCTLSGNTMLKGAACCAGTLYTTVQLATTGCDVPVNTVVQAVADVLVSRHGQDLLVQSRYIPSIGV